MRVTGWAAIALLIGACGVQPDHDDGPRPPAAAATSASPAFASPTGYFATSSCENPNEFVVETPVVAKSLLGCEGSVATPTVTVSVTVGDQLRIVGSLEGGPITPATGQTVLRLDGTTLTALQPGTTTVTTAGQHCYPSTDPCDLLTVVVTAR